MTTHRPGSTAGWNDGGGVGTAGVATARFLWNREESYEPAQRPAAQMRQGRPKLGLKYDGQKNHRPGPEIFQKPSRRRKLQEMPDQERHSHQDRQPHHDLDGMSSLDQQEDLIENKSDQEDIDRR